MTCLNMFTLEVAWQSWDTFKKIKYNLLERFSAKIQLATLGEHFRHSPTYQQKSLAIGNRASVNEYTDFIPISQYLPPATKLGQGYVFTGVCHSVNRGST